MFITNKAIYVTNIISSAHTIYLFFSRYKKTTCKLCKLPMLLSNIMVKKSKNERFLIE